MSLQELTLDQYQEFLDRQQGYSFLQTREMATLLTKRGMTVRPMALIKDDQVMVAGILYSLPMTG